jgi:hypothetical protein
MANIYQYGTPSAPPLISSSSPLPPSIPAGQYIPTGQHVGVHTPSAEIKLPIIGDVTTSYNPESGMLTYERVVESSTGPPVDTVKQYDLKGVAMDATLGFGSFMFGLIVGILIILIILLFLYLFRVLFFSQVPTSYSTCTTEDYYNDPGQALANTGLHASDILYVQNGTLFYKRVPITRTCTPGADQTVSIPFPQYCLFERNTTIPIGTTIEDGDINDQLGIGRTNGVAPHNTQASYDVQTWMDQVSAASNCEPVSGAEYGRPLARWDPN